MEERFVIDFLLSLGGFIMVSCIAFAIIACCAFPFIIGFVFIYYKLKKDNGKSEQVALLEKTYFVFWIVGSAVAFLVFSAFSHDTITFANFAEKGIIFPLCAAFAAFIACTILSALLGFFTRKINEWASNHIELKKPFQNPLEGKFLISIISIYIASGLFAFWVVPLSW